MPTHHANYIIIHYKILDTTARIKQSVLTVCLSVSTKIAKSRDLGRASERLAIYNEIVKNLLHYASN